MPIWVGIVIAAFTGIGGGGGVAAILKARSDRQLGIDAGELAEDNALTERWKQLATAQVQLLMEPLRAEVSRLGAEIEKVKAESERVKAESEVARTRYWKAISYVRTLNSWIAKHVTDSTLTPPPPPADLADDI